MEEQMARMLSIEVGHSTTKIVEMDYQSKKPKIYKCLEMDTPAGAVDDGYLRAAAREGLADAIRETLRENRVHTKRVLFTVFSSRIITREIVLPAVKVHQIQAVIESNVTEYFPVELSEYKISHMLINTFKDGTSAGKHKVLVIAAEKLLLEGYEQLADEIGLNIVDIDYAGNSIFQAVRGSVGAGAVMNVKIEDENALITIIRQGVMVMQRTVNYNMGHHDDAPVSAAEAVKTLVNTVLRVVDFYATNNEDGKIEQIYLTGEGSKEDVILEFMTEQTQIHCHVLDTIRGVTAVKQAADARSNVFAAAIGAGIASVGFDAEKERERHETNYVSASALVILFFAVVSLALVAIALVPYNMALMEQKDLQKKQEQYAPAKQVYDQYVGMQNLIAQVRYGNALTMNSNDGILEFLTELEEKLPQDVEVTDFSSDESQCVISMRVSDKEKAAGVIKTLREFETIQSLTVESIIEEKLDEEMDSLDNMSETTVSFTLTADYAVQTPAAPELIELLTEDAAAQTTEPAQTAETIAQ